MNSDKQPLNKSTSLALGCAGAVLGAAVGWFGFGWLVSKGIYAMVLPGGALGIGAGALVRHRSVGFSASCCVAAVALGLLNEWRHFPFSTDASLGYFLTHLHQLTPKTLIFVALGGFIGFYLPFRAKLFSKAA